MRKAEQGNPSAAQEPAQNVIHGRAVAIGIQQLVEHPQPSDLTMTAAAAQKPADHPGQPATLRLLLGGFDLVVRHLPLQPALCHGGKCRQELADKIPVHTGSLGGLFCQPVSGLLSAQKRRQEIAPLCLTGRTGRRLGIVAKPRLSFAAQPAEHIDKPAAFRPLAGG